MASFPIYHPADYWKIYYDTYVNGEKKHSGIYWKAYKHKSSAIRAAKRIFSEPIEDIWEGEIRTYKWTVGKER